MRHATSNHRNSRFLHGPARSLLLLLALVTPRLVAALEAPTLHVTDPAGTAVTGEYIEILRDPEGILGFDDISTTGASDRFEPAGTETPNLGMTRDWIWVRFRVENETATPLLLELREARIAFVEYWLADSAGAILAHGLGGRFRKGEGQRTAYRFDLFELPITGGERGTVYLRIQSYANLNLDLRLASRAAIDTGARAGYLLLGLFYGALAIMLGYNALLFFDLREPAYLWLCLVIGGALLWRADFDGVLTTLAPGLWPIDWWGMVIGSSTALGSILLFDDAFLELRRHAPHLSRALRMSALVTFSVPLLQAVDPGLEVQASMVLALGICAGSVLLGIWFLKRQPGSAARFLFAWATLLVSIMLLMLVNFGVLPALPMLKNLPYLGILLLLLFLSLAQSARVSALRKAAEDASRALKRNESRLEHLVEERTAELALERDRADAANRAKSQFLANMSHELRTPLNAVLGYSELLADRAYPAPERDYVAGIHGSGRVLLQLIDDILDLSRIEAGGMTLNPHPTNLRPLVSDLGLMFRQKAQKKRLDLRTEIFGDLPAAVLIDPLRLRQILINLLGNAVKFTDRGEIRLSLHCGPACGAPPSGTGAGSVALRFEVADTGRGIPEDEHESVFRMFSQRQGQDQARFGGTGLGLAISRRLAALMGGEITLDSTPGVGSRFALVLPRVSVLAQDPLMEPESVSGRIRFAPSRVLVADDNAANRDVFAAMLRPIGLRVQLVEDGQALLDAAAADPPDLILTDLAMPVMDGLMAVRRLRGDPRTAAIPIVVVTASASGENEAEIRPLCDRYLIKPVEREQLLEALRGFLDATVYEPTARDHAPAGSPNENADRGSRRAEEPPPAAASASPGEPERRRILVVDDDPVIRLLVTSQLQKLSLIVETAQSAETAIEVVAEDPARFALVLMDVQMTPMSGIEATERLRADARFGATPIIGLTADTASETRARCLDAGMHEVMSKPFEPRDLDALVARWLPEDTGEDQRK